VVKRSVWWESYWTVVKRYALRTSYRPVATAFTVFQPIWFLPAQKGAYKKSLLQQFTQRWINKTFNLSFRTFPKKFFVEYLEMSASTGAPFWKDFLIEANNNIYIYIYNIYIYKIYIRIELWREATVLCGH